MASRRCAGTGPRLSANHGVALRRRQPRNRHVISTKEASSSATPRSWVARAGTGLPGPPGPKARQDSGSAGGSGHRTEGHHRPRRSSGPVDNRTGRYGRGLHGRLTDSVRYAHRPNGVVLRPLRNEPEWNAGLVTRAGDPRSAGSCAGVNAQGQATPAGGDFIQYRGRDHSAGPNRRDGHVLGPGAAATQPVGKFDGFPRARPTCGLKGGGQLRAGANNGGAIHAAGRNVNKVAGAQPKPR